MGERVRADTELNRKRHGYLALRLLELASEPNPEALITAMFRAKVQEHKARRGEDDFSVRARAGQYCNAVSLCRDAWWDSNLAAGRAWLASGGRPTTNGAARGRTFVPHAEEESLV